MQKPTNKENKTNFNPIKCERCGSINIAITTEYHKSIYYRILKFIFLSITIAILINNIQTEITKQGESSYGLFIIFVFFYLISEIAVQYIESKTNIQCICRDCGNFWLHKN